MRPSGIALSSSYPCRRCRRIPASASPPYPSDIMESRTCFVPSGDGWPALLFTNPSRHSPRRRTDRRCRQLVLEYLEVRDVPSGFAQPDYVILSGGGAKPFGSPGPTGTTPAQIRQAYGFNQISFNGPSRATAAARPSPSSTPTTTPTSPATCTIRRRVRPARPDLHQGQPDRRQHDAGGQRRLGQRDRPRRRMGPRHRAGGQHPARRGQRQLVHEPVHGRQLRRQAAGRRGRVDELGRRRVLRRDQLRQHLPRRPAATPASPSSLVRRQRRPDLLSVGLAQRPLGRRHHVEPQLGRQHPQRIGLERQRRRHQRRRVQPSYQNGVVTQSTTKRTNPDVAYDADPNTGFPVYDSYNNGTSAPWAQFGGTSDAAPQWAALIAIADQGRHPAGLSPLDGASQTLPMLYALPASDFHDPRSARAGPNGPWPTPAAARTGCREAAERREAFSLIASGRRPFVQRRERPSGSCPCRRAASRKASRPSGSK